MERYNAGCMYVTSMFYELLAAAIENEVTVVAISFVLKSALMIETN